MHLNWQFIILILEPSFILTFLHHMSTTGHFWSPPANLSLPLQTTLTSPCGGRRAYYYSSIRRHDIHFHNYADDTQLYFAVLAIVIGADTKRKTKLISKLKSLTLSPRHQAKNRGGILDTNLIFDGRSRIWLTLPKCLCFSSRPILKNQCMLLSLVGWIIVMSFLAHRKKPQNNFNLCKI